MASYMVKKNSLCNNHSVYLITGSKRARQEGKGNSEKLNSFVFFFFFFPLVFNVENLAEMQIMKDKIIAKLRCL